MNDATILLKDGTTLAAEFIPAAACENACRRKHAAHRSAAWRARNLGRARKANTEAMRRRRAAKRGAA